MASWSGRFPKGLPYKTFVKLKKVVLVPLRVFSLKRSTMGAFAVPFRVLSRRKILTEENMLF